MLRIDGRVLAGSILGLFLVGAAAGFLVGGGPGPPAPTDDTRTPTTVAVTDEGTPGPTSAPPESTTAAVTAASTPATTARPTQEPVPTATAAPSPTETAARVTRTRILIRRFEEREIRRHLERLLNDWRERKGLTPYRTSGNVVSELRFMATNHSTEMADAGTVAYTIDGRSSYDRYRQYKLDQTCKFKRNGESWIVTPKNAQLELIGKTYAGRTYVDNGTRKFNADEREVAQAIFEDWLSRLPFRYRLKFDNTTHIGVGIETTGDNEVYATADLCGAGPVNGTHNLP